VWLDAVFGTHVFVGDVSGRRVEMTLHGSRMTTTATCTFSADATLEATLTGDVLDGTITYTAVTNHDPSCGYLETCESVARLNGARPPAP
jgi:hypothetical protein